MEQKTILEEILEDAPIQRERKKKLAGAKRCISHEEWAQAAALLCELEEKHPDDSEVAALRRQLVVEKAIAEEHYRELERKKQERREMRKQKRFFIAVALCVLILASLAAAVYGVTYHRRGIAPAEETQTAVVCVVDKACSEATCYKLHANS